MVCVNGIKNDRTSDGVARFSMNPVTVGKADEKRQPKIVRGTNKL